MSDTLWATTTTYAYIKIQHYEKLADAKRGHDAQANPEVYLVFTCGLLSIVFIDLYFVHDMVHCCKVYNLVMRQMKQWRPSLLEALVHQRIRPGSPPP